MMRVGNAVLTAAKPFYNARLSDDILHLNEAFGHRGQNREIKKEEAKEIRGFKNVPILASFSF